MKLHELFKPKIGGEPLKQGTPVHHNVHHLHWMMHGLTAFAMFVATVIVDVQIVKHHNRHHVLWPDGTTTDYVPPTRMPVAGDHLEMGVAESGDVVWRYK